MIFHEFDNIRWKSGMIAIYDGEEKTVIAINFAERLICLESNNKETDWVRCENVKLK